MKIIDITLKHTKEFNTPYYELEYDVTHMYPWCTKGNQVVRVTHGRDLAEILRDFAK